MNVKKLIYTSSCVVDGNQSSHDKLVLDNNAHHAPVSIYGATKTKIYNTRFDVRSICEACDYEKTLIHEEKIEYQSDNFGLDRQLDDTLFQQEIGFNPQYSMDHGLKNLINYIRKANCLPEFK